MPPRSSSSRISRGRYDYINRRYEELHDITNAEIHGLTDLGRFGPETAEQFRAHDRIVIEAGRPLEFDAQVPSKGGTEVMQELLQIDPRVYGTVSSGHSNDAIMASYEEAGFKAVIPKPCTAGDLARVLERINDPSATG